MNLNGGAVHMYQKSILYIYIYMCLQTTVANSKQFPVNIQTNVENPLPADPYPK